MRILYTCIAMLLCAAPALAAPEAAKDDMAQFLSEQGIVGRITSMGTRVESRASELVMNSLGFLGVPYRRGGNSVETGFDCSGFVRTMYQQVAGLVLPRRAAEQAAATRQIDKAELQPGDLVFFNTMRRAFSHVGIYIGDGKFIHSPRSGAQIRVEDMSVKYWNTRFDGARRVLPDEPTFTPASTNTDAGTAGSANGAGTNNP